jgi:hypothetical protein
MMVSINDHIVFVLEGMTVRHALLATGLREGLEMAAVRDEWGNEVGLDGALHDGQNLFVTPTCFPHNKR